MKTCKRLGFVGDVDFDMETGCMLALIVPGPGCICGFLGREKEYIIPFCDICQVGNDIILVDIKEKDVSENIKCRIPPPGSEQLDAWRHLCVLPESPGTCPCG